MGASGKKQLEVILNYTDKLSGRSGRTIKSLASVESQAKRTTAAVKLLNKELGRGGGKSSKGSGRLPTEIQLGTRLTRQLAAETARGLKLETQQARLLREQTKTRTEGVRLAREETRLSEQIARAQRPTPAPRTTTPRRAYRPGDWMHDSDRPPDWRKELGDTRPPRRRAERADAPGRLERFGHRAGKVREAAYDFGDAYAQAREGVQRYTDPASELMRSRARLGALGLSGGEAARADESIKKVVAEVKGARLTEVTQAFAELYEVFGSVEDTARNLPRAAQYSFSLKTLHGDRYNSEQLTAQTKSAYKFIDLLGLTKPDAEGKVNHARADAYHDQLMQVLSATGGDVDPREMQQLAKIGGTSLLGMNREGLTHMAALASDVGGSRAGNLQRSLFQSFVGGKLFPRHIKRLSELGMLDESKVLKKTGGKFELMPGAIKHAETISTDPLIFVDKFAEALSRKGIDTTNESQVVNAVAGVTGNTLSQQMLAQLIIRRGEVSRFDEIVAKAEPLDKLYGRASSLPLGSIEDSKAKQENWRATAGGPMLDAGGTFSSHLGSFYADLQKFAEGSPVMAAALGGITGLGNASLSAGEGVGTLAGLLRDLRGGGGGQGGGGGVLGTGLDGSDALAAGWGVGKFLKWGGRSLLGAGSAVAGAAASPYVATALALTAGGVGLYTRNRAVKANEAADGARAGLFESAGRLREQSGGRLPDQIAKSLGSTAFEQLNRAGDLTTKLEPGLYGAYQRVYDPSPYRGWLRPFDGERAPGVFKQRAPELAFPEVMRAFVADVTRRVGAGQISPEAGQRTLKTAEAAWPESFKTATAEAASGLAKLPEPATQTGKALADILTPSRSLPASLSHLGGSLDSLAARVNGLEIRVPSIVLPPVGGATGGAAGGKTKSGYKLGIDPLNIYPPSAVGSVVERDGLAEVHRGNTIFPASLSRRRPGDWLESAEAIGGMGEGAGVPDYSQFATSGGGAQITVHVGDINVTGGADARETGAAVATEVESQVREALARLAALESDVYDPRFVANMTARELNWQRERA